MTSEILGAETNIRQLSLLSLELIIVLHYISVMERNNEKLHLKNDSLQSFSLLKLKFQFVKR